MKIYMPHTRLTLIISALLAATGQVVGGITFEKHIPPIVLETLQCGAWAVAIIAGIMSIRGRLRRYYNEKKKNHKPE